MKISNKIWLFGLLISVSAAGNSAKSFTFTHNLTIGIHGDEVSALQQFLIEGGFLKIVAPTGYFGPLTKEALRVWQAKVGIYSSGFFGPTSIAILKSENGSTTQPTGLPVRLKIPKLAIDASFQYNGLKSDGTMEIPNNIFDVGWFTGSPHPGEKGNAIVTGHVAQIRGGVLTKLGVFSNLNELRPGDTLYILNDKGAFITFMVREIRSYDPAADAADVFRSGDGGVHLNLITCEGAWNPDKLSYSQRLVIFTDAI